LLVGLGFFGLGMIGIEAASIVSKLSVLSKPEKENKGFVVAGLTTHSK